MNDKRNFTQRFAQVKWRKNQKQGTSVTGGQTSANHNNDTHAGLNAPRAILHAVQRKAQHTNESNPENAAVNEAIQDGKDISEASAAGIKAVVRRNMQKKIYAAEEAEPQTAVEPTQSAEKAMDITTSSQNTQSNTAAQVQSRKSIYTHSSNNAPSCYSVSKPGSVAPVHAERQLQAARQSAATRAALRQITRTATSTVKVVGKTTKEAAKGAKAVGKAALSLGKKLLSAMVVAWPFFLIMLIVVILLVIIISPMGIFYSNNEDNPNQIGELVPQIEDEWLGSLAATRQQYEDKGYIVTVNYGVASGDDGSRVNNWKDCIALYAVHKSGGEMATLTFDDDDQTAIHDLFFAMNTISVETRTEVIETEVEREAHKTKWVWNGKKFKQVTYTETETVIETEEIYYADIWVQNLRYIQMLGQYPLSKDEKGMVDFLMDYQHDPLWRELGISTLPDDAYPGDLSDLINNLPPGQFGSRIVELALSRLGHPYSMDLRGQGNYIDCSGLTQWCYAQVNISLPWTAADQAKWCADSGKVIDASTAQPGDLIFYTSDSQRVANRFMKIGHVGIYAGNGMMIDASSTKGCVVYRAVYGSPVMWARPG